MEKEVSKKNISAGQQRATTGGASYQGQGITEQSEGFSGAAAFPGAGFFPGSWGQGLGYGYGYARPAVGAAGFAHTGVPAVGAGYGQTGMPMGGVGFAGPGMPTGVPGMGHSGMPIGPSGAAYPGVPGVTSGGLPTGTMMPAPVAGHTQQVGNVPGQLPIEESYIENILRLNLGKMATLYMTYENNTEWNAKIFRGILEAAGRDHIIISDPKTGMRFLLLMVNLDYVTFDQPLKYTSPFQTGSR